MGSVILGPDGLPLITRRNFMKGATLAVGAAALAGCGPTASPAPSATASGASAAPSVSTGGLARLIMSDGNSGDNLLATKMPNTFTPIMFLSMYDTILRNDNGFQPTAGIAESWEDSDNAKTWTFKIRKGVTFHDGTPMTAKDVAYSLKFVMREEAATYTGSLLRPVLNPDNIKALDDTTLQLVLDRTFVFVPYVLGIRYSLVFKDGTTDDDLLTKDPVGTGPFVYQAFTPGQSFSATRNPDYWDEGKPYLDEFEITNIPEEASKFEALVSDQADIIGYTNFALAAQLEGDANHEPFPFQDAAWNGLCCNIAVEPFDKPQVIKAMKLGLDRAQFIETAFAGLATMGYDTPFPDTEPFFPADMDSTTRDVAGAKSLLAEAGYPNGLDLPFDLVIVTSLGSSDIAAVAKEQLAEVGIRFNIREGGPTFWDTVYLKEPFILPDWNRRPPFEIYGLLTTTENMTKFESAELQAALDAASSTTDIEAQRIEYAKAQHITAEQDGLVVPAYSPRLHAKSKGLRDVRPNFFGFLDFSGAYFS
jgi:peptide/nickel transport system substrate-binding protein